MPEPMTFEPNELRTRWNNVARALIALVNGEYPKPFDGAEATVQLKRDLPYLREFIEGAAASMEAVSPGKKGPTEDGDCGCPEPAKSPPPAGPRTGTSKITPDIEAGLKMVPASNPGAKAGSAK
jgi:hypothetical protein